MIRGYYLKYAPYMDKYTKEEIMGDLDLLREDKRGYGKVQGKETSKRNSYKGGKFYITLFKFTNEDNKIVLLNIYKTLEKALPRFVKVFELKSGHIVVATPYFGDKIEDYTYNMIMDELLRITSFIIDLNSSHIVDFIRDYANINVYIEEDHKND